MLICKQVRSFSEATAVTVVKRNFALKANVSYAPVCATLKQMPPARLCINWGGSVQAHDHIQTDFNYCAVSVQVSPSRNITAVRYVAISYRIEDV